MAGSMNKRLRLLREQVEACGGAEIRVEIGRHAKIFFRNPQGIDCMLVAALSPSDWRDAKTVRAKLRRLMKAAGPEPWVFA